MTYYLDLTSFWGYLLYWLPLVVCTVGYTFRSMVNHDKDVEARAAYVMGEKNAYHPRETIGHLVGRFFATIIPGLNLWCAVMDVSPKMFVRFFDWIGNTFSQPLVPEVERQKEHDYES